jgi:spermidine synthase
MQVKKWLSFLIPINIFSQKSNYSKTLEVSWTNGKLVLDSKNTNYSYGSLQRILKIGLHNIGFDKIKSMQEILILGVAGGSVIKTLVNEIYFEGKIKGVEIDETAIEIANTYFGLDKIKNLEIIIDDAFEFVFKTNDTFDLVIIDIFEDDKMPDFLFNEKFVNQIQNIVNQKGFVLFNTMNLIDNQNYKFISCFDANKFAVKKISKIEQYNELIIFEKL